MSLSVGGFDQVLITISSSFFSWADASATGFY